MGNSCTATPAATTNEHPAAVKRAPKRYTSRKSVASTTKHDQRRRLTEEQEASERCVAALRDGEATVFGTPEHVTPRTLLMQKGNDEGCCVAFATGGLSMEFANEHAVGPLNSGNHCSATDRKQQHGLEELSVGIMSAGEESSASSGAKARESISSWTVSQNQLGGGNGEGESFERTASWASCAPLSTTHPNEQLASATADSQNSPLLINDGATSPNTPRSDFDTNGITSSYPDTL